MKTKLLNLVTGAALTISLLIYISAYANEMQLFQNVIDHGMLPTAELENEELKLQNPALTAGSVRGTTIIADDTNCTLIDAITAANTDTATGGCTAGNGKDIIELTADVALTTAVDFTDGANGLPSVTSTITVNGHGHTIARSSANGTDSFRLLHVAESGNLTLNQVTLENGLEPDLNGGALFNCGTVTLTDSIAPTVVNWADPPIVPMGTCGNVFDVHIPGAKAHRTVDCYGEGQGPHVRLGG